MFMLRRFWALALLGLWGCEMPFQPLFSTLSVKSGYYIPPEYEPVSGILMSEHLATFPNGRQLLQAVLNQDTEVWMLTTNVANLQWTRQDLGRRFGMQPEDLARLKPIPVATQTVWARDWAPIFTYSTTQANRVGLLDLVYYPERPIDDVVPSALTQFFNQLGPQINQQFGLELFPELNFQHLPVDVEMEGGNLMCTRQHCFISEEVVLRAQGQSQSQTRSQTREQILAELEKHLDQDFWVVPRMPHESTGHIDIWAKFLDAGRVIVGQISDQSLAEVPFAQQAIYREVQAFLEMQATGLDATGQPVPESLAAVLAQTHPEIQIARIPMPTPGVYQGVETFRTYTNSLLLNEVAIVPRYLRGANRPSFAQREQTQLDEAEVTRVYNAAGYQVLWIPADNLIRDGGAWHCVAMQIPQLPGPRQD